jgi:putative FmdB family regulatory protein
MTSYLSPMPIYEFHCERCGRDSEVLARSSDWQGTLCPRCGSTKLRKKLSVFASATAGSDFTPPPCGNGGGSCCRCGTGKPHRH